LEAANLPLFFLRFRLTSLSGCTILKLALQIVSGDWATPKMMKQGFFISSAYQTRRSARPTIAGYRSPNQANSCRQGEEVSVHRAECL
jgi:hypothetical protein